MRIVVHAPFGMIGQEAGVLSLLACYLNSSHPEVVQLKCNGLFALCDRDGEDNWTRDMGSCFRCLRDQHSMAGWSGLRTENLSRYLSASDAKNARRWVLGLDDQELLEAQYQGRTTYVLCKGSFVERFGVERPDLCNRNHSAFLRRLMVGAAHACVAAENFQKKFRPDLSLLAGARDFITSSFAAVAKELGSRPVTFRWDIANRCVQIRHPEDGRELPCELVLDNLSKIRSDVQSWPEELIAILEEIVNFLDIDSNQLSLPIA